MNSNSNSIDVREALHPIDRNWVDTTCRKQIVRQLGALQFGHIQLDDGDHQNSFGNENSHFQSNISVTNPRFYRSVLFSGELGLAQSFIDGDWSSDHLTKLLRIFIQNIEIANQSNQGWATPRQFIARMGHWLKKNTRLGSARNISEHYDLGNDFYRLFLDDTMSYSCGIFEQNTSTMLDASLTKLKTVCQKLDLNPSDHLLEIGTGWGGLAVFAAKNYGCQVTTTTISVEQYKVALERVEKAGLASQVTVLLCDYRDLEGKFDKLVSIEMIEAVGHQYFDTFFKKCHDLLQNNGMMLLQGILIKEQRYKQYLRNVDFIRKYIFPGGCLPSVTALMQSVSNSSDFRLLHSEDIASHYAQTMRCWQQEFNKNLPQVRELGYSETFIRMWNYYLCYCEAAFEERQCNTVQMLFAKPKCRVDVVGRSFSLVSHSNEVLA
ncbi:MAG: class I SAM-dependent methyltransferase [Pirellulales bacterium]|jgi:cyclopropane-fatty-acyl-phospholipid synthase